MQPPKDTGRPPRKILRIVIPAYPAFNIYSRVAAVTSALGPVSVATAVNDIPGWDAEVIDGNNYRRGSKDEAGWLELKKLGFDPATASSIFLTTATDVASMGFFLGIAALWLG